jgi:hypothetical protein
MDDSLAFLNPMLAQLKLRKLGEVKTAQPASANASAPAPAPAPWTQNRFMDRLRWQESGPFISDEERSLARGDSGNAVGPYQIWPIYVKEVNRIFEEELKSPKRFTNQDRLNRQKSEEMIDVFLSSQIKKFRKKYGKEPTETELARLHHSGGISGAYWGTDKDIEYGNKFDTQSEALEKWENTDYGLRKDNTRKGYGFFGPISMRDANGRILPNQFATEISVGVNINGKEVEIPTLVPSLSSEERMWLTTVGNDPRNNPAIMNKAIKNAQSRIAKGLSPFRDTPPPIKKK